MVWILAVKNTTGNILQSQKKDNDLKIQEEQQELYLNQEPLPFGKIGNPTGFFCKGQAQWVRHAQQDVRCF